VTRIQANLLLLAISLIWGSAFVAQSHGMADVGPMLFTGVRFLLGAAVVAPLAWAERRKLAGQGRALTRRDSLTIAGLGLLITAGAAMQQIGLVSTSITNAGFLTALYVPLVPVLSWLLLNQLPHWSVWPGALACLIGAFLLSGARELNVGLGDLWVIGSALPWALHVLVVGRVADRMAAPFTVAFGQFLTCGLVSMAIALGTEPLSLAGLRGAAWPIVYTGVMSVAIAYTGQVIAQRYAQAADAAIILSSETLFTAVFGYLLMGDRLDDAGLFGCGLILAAMLAIQLVPLLPGRRLQAS